MTEGGEERSGMPGALSTVGREGGAGEDALREEPVVRLDGIRKRFGYREVLRGVDLEIRRGECIVLLGPNGAGKSTLLRIIATEWRASAGEVSVFGERPSGAGAAIRRRLGAVYHQSFLRPELTLDENLRFYADLYGVRLGERSSRLIERLGLAARRHEPVRTFSQGMMKRANIVRSLLHDPALWLLDEPFSGLDPAGCGLFRAMVEEFILGGGTVVLVTHQIDIARPLATRFLRVADGRLREDGAAPSPPEVSP